MKSETVNSTKKFLVQVNIKHNKPDMRRKHPMEKTSKLLPKVMECCDLHTNQLPV